jgi:high-affinity iron transporter
VLFSFLVTLREGFEIALVVAIVLGYLARTGNRRQFRAIWLGTGAAVALTAAAVVVLQLTASELSGAAQEAFEGFTMLLAVAVLTWMVFWMRRQAAGIGRELRSQVDVAVAGGSLLALAGLAFSAVIREGIETALFLFAGSTASRGSALLFWTGGALGFAIAAALGYAVYRGSGRLPIRQFFTITGIVVLVLGAGLLSNGIAALQVSGVIANLGPRPWDTDALLSVTTTAGKFLHTLLGYDPAPTWGQIVLFWAYLAIGLAAFAGGLRAPRRTAAHTERAVAAE